MINEEQGIFLFGFFIGLVEGILIQEVRRLRKIRLDKKKEIE